MAKVIANMSMSLDGFIAGPHDEVDHLFGWYGTGDVEIPTAMPGLSLHVSQASADVLREAHANVGALVVGRRLFDLTKGWGGRHPMDVPVFVRTHAAPVDWAHPEAPFTFVTDGLQSAIDQAKATAGDGWVGVGSKVASQCLDAGLLDEIHVDLVPVVLGGGIPFFEGLSSGPFVLEGPDVVEGDGVTHLRYRVKRE